ncbi:LPS export ABC transporter periplasmic protein LptC [Shewanella canadensis]|uniref:Lipopolysaccharide export system protein LptC n=1 Tax=Shewanella canadensis TaxID=271096 RepID=A0A3S0KYY3_9GAMM|nr:LPS export ABC transporter periplasmic protein LptC [Shewanella canadensis]RTR40633.1 LPS export ABC transporter periplasmic protein LptC [Shewanella canadensis]
MNRVTLAIIAFFGMALILYWQVQSKRGEEEVAIDASLRPDYVADNLRSVEYNELGLVNSRVTATHMEHFEEANMTYFTQPIYLVYPDKGQAQWRLRSSKGTLNKKSGKVILEKDVIIDAISPEEPVQTIKTTYLELDLNTMVMTSDRDIYITGSDFKIKGVGLYADLNAQSVQLTSQVEGIYEAK